MAAALVIGSVNLHLHQAEKLGEAKTDCELRFSNYELQKQKELARLEANLRMNALVEQQRLQREKEAVAAELQDLRGAFDVTVDALEGELEELAQRQPEIVPWLDAPVPPSLLQD